MHSHKEKLGDLAAISLEFFVECILDAIFYLFSSLVSTERVQAIETPLMHQNSIVYHNQREANSLVL